MTTTLHLIEDYPLISSDPESTLAFYLDEFFTLWLTYEGQREFLSTPRPFVLIKATLWENPELNTGALTLSDKQWRALSKQQHGIYSCQEEDSDEQQFIFYSPKLTVECFAKDIQLCGTHYHQRSVHRALNIALNSDIITEKKD